MEFTDLNLTETEMRYFGDLFLCCDEESNGKIPILKAMELFRSSNVSNDVLKQIMDISVAPNNYASLNHMKRKQFYSALKLIAAHQTNMALKPELLSTPLDLPLPRFTWALNSEANADLIQLSNSPKEQHISKRERNFGGNLGAYEPIRVSSNLSDSDVPQALSHDATEALSTDSEMESETMSQRSGSHGRRGKNGSPWSTASESPTPTNSVAERVHPVWEHSATGRGVWPTNTAEEHTRLLGTEEESSDRHSSEEEGEGEAEAAWAISEAQARHYAAQFAQLRPERGLLSGPTARLFFEKSRLSVPDLRKIWQLSDITKDGMLTLEEFSIAMHLIVLRRNNIPVPDTLPACLIPQVDSRFSQTALTTDLVDLGSDMFSSGSSADFSFVHKTEPEAKKPEPDRPPSLSPPKPEPQLNNKEWTKFVDSPTSSVSSPGPKPVNFDFHKSAVERDPKIFHPVALRVTPDAAPHDDVRASASPRRDDFAHAFELASPKRLNSQPPAEPPPNGAEIKSIQRPQPRKPVKTAGVLPPPPAREPVTTHDEGPASLQYAPKKEPPPPPPPRPLRNHTRSSSLDLNRLKSTAPPAPPPRVSPSHASPPARRPLTNQRSEGERGEPAFPPDAFAPREYEGDGFGYARDDAPKMHGAFEVYRKPSRESSCEADPDVKSLQEQNAVLHRVCRALCAELADAQREREALRVRLGTHTPV
ncbi:ralBP1-associated Eps domain-containing protein 1 isoform X7 [Ostrinia furnacalis]|uniref:ralBP1-associated Eps domain-containing protein 1 isoform X5 n=1 Tax=Ostrinia furnacalis TaxID=93504 RepID=UPI00103B36E6|nr:ralBP1-associated Eps domain-containing protein 1 isoform X5 [Ostrinia furnacalis]XP_028162086.1 ralBP1-associated Eps domain-containing protein 1 isoform X6 [Ostrinia furnacalis]XP_028162087.1 ralBP1-associated Eps domain-containing protein 1 isoform X7 [Ostrinia furnacalis]